MTTPESKSVSPKKINNFSDYYFQKREMDYVLNPIRRILKKPKLKTEVIGILKLQCYGKYADVRGNVKCLIDMKLLLTDRSKKIIWLSKRFDVYFSKMKRNLLVAEKMHLDKRFNNNDIPDYGNMAYPTGFIVPSIKFNDIPDYGKIL